jgi:hypothetical protein
VQASEGDDLRGVLERARGAFMAALKQGRNSVIGQKAQGGQVREAPIAVT